MSTVSTLSIFLPEEALQLSLVLGGIALIVGARRLGTMLIGAGIAIATLAPVVGPVLREAPGWVRELAVVCAVIVALRIALTLLIGRRATDAAMGQYFGTVLVSLIRLPLVALRGGFATLTTLIRRVL